MKIFTVLL